MDAIFDLLLRGQLECRVTVVCLFEWTVAYVAIRGEQVDHEIILEKFEKSCRKISGKKKILC